MAPRPSVPGAQNDEVDLPGALAPEAAPPPTRIDRIKTVTLKLGHRRKTPSEESEDKDSENGFDADSDLEDDSDGMEGTVNEGKHTRLQDEEDFLDKEDSSDDTPAPRPRVKVITLKMTPIPDAARRKAVDRAKHTRVQSGNDTNSDLLTKVVLLRMTYSIPRRSKPLHEVIAKKARKDERDMRCRIRTGKAQSDRPVRPAKKKQKLPGRLLRRRM